MDKDALERPWELLKEARIAAELSQRDLAARAGIHPSMVSAYERRERMPTVATLNKLLAAAGVCLLVELAPLHTLLDARIRAALDAPPVERDSAVAWICERVTWAFAGFPFAIDGLAAAAVQGVPVPVERTSVLLLDDEEAIAVIGPRLFKGGTRFWCPERNRYVMTDESTQALREHRPSAWLDPVGIRYTITLCGAERLERCARVPFGDLDLRVTSLWDLELADPDAAAVLQRTRELIAARDGGLPTPPVNG